MIKAVIFDLDHTLFDRYATEARIIPRFYEHFDMAVSQEQATALLIYADRNFAQRGWPLMLDWLIENGMFNKAPGFEDFREFLLSSFTKTAVPFWFTIPTLKKIKEMGYKTGLITNGRPEIQHAKLGMTGIEPYLDEIVISGDTPYRKPDPAIFGVMTEKTGFDPSEMLYVGDNPKNDVECARLAGYTPVWVNTTHIWTFPEIEKPELIVDDISELPELLKSL